MTSRIGSREISRAVAAVENLDRRGFLKFAALSAGVAGLGAAGLLAGEARAAMPEGLRFMGEAEHKVFTRVMQVSLPTAGTKLLPPDQVPVMQTLDAALLGMMAPFELAGLKDGVAAFEQAPVEAHGKPFSELDDATATAFCDAWGDSDDMNQRGLVTALKKLVELSYWANPPTWEPLGYDGPVSDKWGLTTIGNAPMPSE